MSLVRNLLVTLAIAAGLAWRVDAAWGQPPVIRREYALKADILRVLSETMTWPKEAAPATGKPLVIGILGQDPFFENGQNQLDAAVAKAKANGRLLAVQRFDSAKDYKACHLLFVSNTAAAGSVEKTLAARLAAAQGTTEGAPVLIVGEAPGLAQRGAVANLVFDRAKNLIRLEINPAAAARAGVTPLPGIWRSKLVDRVQDPQG